MRTKITLLLLLLNVALLAVILYTRHEWNTEKSLAETRRNVLGDEVVGLLSIEIKNSATGDILRLGRDTTNDPWSITAPINWPANDFAVKRIINELLFLKNETTFRVKDLRQNGQDLSEYGLNPPALLLAFTRAPALTGGVPVTTTLGIGDTTKIGNRLYLLSPDRQNVEVVNRSLADSLRQGLEQLRSDSLFTIPVYEVRSLGLQIPGPDGKTARIRVRRDDTLWSFEAPIVAPASRPAVETTVVGLNALRAGHFLTKAGSTPERTGLDASTLRVTLEGTNRRETLVIGQPVAPPGPDATEFYAQLEGRDQVFTTSLPNKLSALLHRAQDTLRDPRILPFDPAAVTAITLTPDFTLQRLDPPAGGPATWQIVLRSGPQGSRTLPADTDRVTHLLQRLALLSATPHPGKDGKIESGFLSDAPSAADLENWGFNLPARAITLSFAQPPPPPAGTVSAAGAVPAKTLLLAVSGGTGNFVQARVDGQSFVYAVPQDTLDELPTAPRLYRDRTLRTLPEGARITGINLVDTATGAPVYARQLAPGETWDTALASETAPRRAALETLLARLRTLRAKQFIADTYTPATTLDGRPAPWRYKLETTLALGGGAGDQTTTSTLLLGERTGGGTLLATSAEFNATFEVEQPLLDSLWTLTYGPRDPGAPAAKP